MTMNLAYCCGLLLLGATTTPAQIHPQKKPVRKQAVARRRVTTHVVEAHAEQEYCVASLRPPVVESRELPECRKAYTYVEQMPTLNGQPAGASIAVITQHLGMPPAAPAGRVFVKSEIDERGAVDHVEIIKGLRADLDSAVVAATRRLPRFTPGKQNGRVVIVSVTLPIPIPARKQPSYWPAPSSARHRKAP